MGSAFWYSVNNLKKLSIILLIGLIIRIWLGFLAFNGDIITQAQWAKWIFENGYLGFYDETHWYGEWPNHPPLISLWYGLAYPIQGTISGILTGVGSFIALHHLGATKIAWYYQFVTWFGTATYQLTNLPYGVFFSIKLLPILADLLLGGLIFSLAKKINPKWAIKFLLIYLFSPFVIYISSIWGQSDQISALFLILAFVLVVRKQVIFPFLLIALAANLKPTALLFVPLFLYLNYLQKPPKLFIILGFLVALGSYLLSLSFFTVAEPLSFSLLKLSKILFFTKDPAVSISAFNFWSMIYGLNRISDLAPLLFIPARIWGLIIFILLNLWAMKILKPINLKNTFIALFIVGFGGWLFLTDMYERYLFTGMLAGLLVCLYDPKLLRYWLILSVIFLLDLVHGWIYPEQLESFRLFLISGDGIFVRLLSLANLAIVGLFLDQALKLGLVKNFKKRFKFVRIH